MTYLSLAYDLLQQALTVINVGTLLAVVGYEIFHKETEDDHHPWK